MSVRHDDGRPEPGPVEVMGERRRLVGLAYRLLGSLADAEDVVQETYARWYAMEPGRRDAVASPAAWLTTVASRVCLDLLGSARARRESYVGEWIPEPLPGDWTTGRPATAPPADPADRVTLDESVSMAFLVVLEAMTPAERVAFVLHDVFGYPFSEVAAIVGRTTAACRKLASSARARVRAAPAPVAPAAGHAGIVRDFRRAWEAGDIGGLIGLLDPDATVVADGGGVVTAAPRPITGGARIARYCLAIGGLRSGMTLEERTVNGRPGLVARQADGAVAAVAAFEVAGGLVTRIWAVRNPEKLRPWTGEPPE